MVLLLSHQSSTLQDLVEINRESSSRSRLRHRTAARPACLSQMAHIAPALGFEAFFEAEAGFDTIDPWFLMAEAMTMSHFVGELNMPEESSPSGTSQMSESVFLGSDQAVFNNGSVEPQVLAGSNSATFPAYYMDMDPEPPYEPNYDPNPLFSDTPMGYRDQHYPQGLAGHSSQAVSLEPTSSEIGI